MQADSLPLNDTYSDKFRAVVRSKWEKRNVDFVFSERLDLSNLDPDADGQIYTITGRPVAADLVVSENEITLLDTNLTLTVRYKLPVAGRIRSCSSL